jgi:hypothetical protein
MLFIDQSWKFSINISFGDNKWNFYWHAVKVMKEVFLLHRAKMIDLITVVSIAPGCFLEILKSSQKYPKLFLKIKTLAETILIRVRSQLKLLSFPKFPIMFN